MSAQGWDGEIGFQQFLYPEDKEARKMISWLVQRLPKSGEEAGGEMQGANVQLFQAINDELSSWKKKAWFPAFEKSTAVRLRTCPLLSTSNEDSGYLESALPYITDQATGKASLASSLIQHNVLEVARRRQTEGVDAMDVGMGTATERSAAVTSALKAGFLTSKGAATVEGFDGLVDALKTGSDDSVFSRQTNFNQEVRIARAGGAVVCAVTLRELNCRRKRSLLVVQLRHPRPVRLPRKHKGERSKKNKKKWIGKSANWRTN